MCYYVLLFFVFFPLYVTSLLLEFTSFLFLRSPRDVMAFTRVRCYNFFLTLVGISGVRTPFRQMSRCLMLSNEAHLFEFFFHRFADFFFVLRIYAKYCINLYLDDFFNDITAILLLLLFFFVLVVLHYTYFLYVDVVIRCSAVYNFGVGWVVLFSYFEFILSRFLKWNSKKCLN